MPFRCPRKGRPVFRPWGKRGPRLGLLPYLWVPYHRRYYRQPFDLMFLRELP